LQFRNPPHNIEYFFIDLKNMKLISVFLVTALAATLTACGGGGGGSAVAPVAPAAPVAPVASATPTTVVLTDKYTGTWSNCSSIGEQTTIVVSKSSDNFYTASYELNRFSAYPCTGTAVPFGTGSENFQIVGTKTELGMNRIVDKIVFASDGTKDLIYTDPNVTLSDGSKVALLYFGDEFSALDTAGFPQSLDNTSPLQK
jgi:hypothetical protein